MAWVNGLGFQRAGSYWHHAAVAEMPIAACSSMPGRTDGSLSVTALTSRIAGYVTRTSGGVGGALSDGRPYPYIRHLLQALQENVAGIRSKCDLHHTNYFFTLINTFIICLICSRIILFIRLARFSV